MALWSSVITSQLDCRLFFLLLAFLNLKNLLEFSHQLRPVTTIKQNYTIYAIIDICIIIAITRTSLTKPNPLFGTGLRIIQQLFLIGK